MARCDIPRSEGIFTRHTMTSRSIVYLSQILKSIDVFMDHDLVMFSDITQQILPSNSAKEHLSNNCIF